MTALSSGRGRGRGRGGRDRTDPFAAASQRTPDQGAFTPRPPRKAQNAPRGGSTPFNGAARGGRRGISAQASTPIRGASNAAPNNVYTKPRSAQTPGDWQQRFDTLERNREWERKNAIAQGLVADPERPRLLAEAVTPVGTCQDKCPEYERIRRVVQNDVMKQERDPVTSQFDEYRMVKKFKRPGAGDDEQLPSDLRPPAVLKATCDYLFEELIGSKDSLASVHGYIWDRTRAIRNDFSIQQISKTEDLRIAIDCYERITRFHILSRHQFAALEKPYQGYDPQMEREQLDRTMLSLMHFYEDARGRVDLPNEAEFRAYCIIFSIQDWTPDLEDQVQAWPRNIMNDPRVRKALQLYAAACNTYDNQGPIRPAKVHVIAQQNWARFFKLIKSNQVSYLMACVAEMYCNHVRRETLQQIWIAYRQSKTPDWTLDELIIALGLDDADQAQDFCERYGFTFDQRDDGLWFLDLTSVTGRWLREPSAGIKEQIMQHTLVENKRHDRTMTAVINGMTVRRAADAGMTLAEDAAMDEEQDSLLDDGQSLFVRDTRKPAAIGQPTAISIEKSKSAPTLIGPDAHANPFQFGQPSGFTFGKPSDTTSIFSTPNSQAITRSDPSTATDIAKHTTTTSTFGTPFGGKNPFASQNPSTAALGSVFKFGQPSGSPVDLGNPFAAPPMLSENPGNPKEAIQSNLTPAAPARSIFDTAKSSFSTSSGFTPQLSNMSPFSSGATSDLSFGTFGKANALAASSAEESAAPSIPTYGLPKFTPSVFDAKVGAKTDVTFASGFGNGAIVNPFNFAAPPKLLGTAAGSDDTVSPRTVIFKPATFGSAPDTPLGSTLEFQPPTEQRAPHLQVNSSEVKSPEQSFAPTELTTSKGSLQQKRNTTNNGLNFGSVAHDNIKPLVFSIPNQPKKPSRLSHSFTAEDGADSSPQVRGTYSTSGNTSTPTSAAPSLTPNSHHELSSILDRLAHEYTTPLLFPYIRGFVKRTTREVFDQLQDEASEKFRRERLVRNQLKTWYQNCWRDQLRRKGKEKRERTRLYFAEKKKKLQAPGRNERPDDAAEFITRADQQIELRKNSMGQLLSRADPAPRGARVNSEVHEGTELHSSPPGSWSSEQERSAATLEASNWRKRPSPELDSSEQAHNSQRGHKRLKSTNTGGMGHSTAGSPPNKSGTSFARKPSSYLGFSVPADDPGRSRMKSNYFKLKAMGVNPTPNFQWSSQKGKKRARDDSADSDVSPFRARNPSSSPLRLNETPCHYPSQRPGADADLSASTWRSAGKRPVSFIPKTSDDEVDALIARSKAQRETLAKEVSFFKSAQEKEKLRISQNSPQSSLRSSQSSYESPSMERARAEARLGATLISDSAHQGERPAYWYRESKYVPRADYHKAIEKSKDMRASRSRDTSRPESRLAQSFSQAKAPEVLVDTSIESTAHAPTVAESQEPPVMNGFSSSPTNFHPAFQSFGDASAVASSRLEHETIWPPLEQDDPPLHGLATQVTEVSHPAWSQLPQVYPPSQDHTIQPSQVTAALSHTFGRSQNTEPYPNFAAQNHQRPTQTDSYLNTNSQPASEVVSLLSSSGEEQQQAQQYSGHNVSFSHYQVNDADNDTLDPSLMATYGSNRFAQLSYLPNEEDDSGDEEEPEDNPVEVGLTFSEEEDKLHEGDDELLEGDEVMLEDEEELQDGEEQQMEDENENSQLEDFDEEEEGFGDQEIDGMNHAFHGDEDVNNYTDGDDEFSETEEEPEEEDTRFAGFAQPHYAQHFAMSPAGGFANVGPLPKPSPAQAAEEVIELSD